MIPILGAIVKGVVTKAVERKLETTVGVATAAVGTAAIVDPDLLQMIPDNIRGYAVLAVVVTLCIRSIVSTVGAAYKDARSNTSPPQ